MSKDSHSQGIPQKMAVNDARIEHSRQAISLTDLFDFEEAKRQFKELTGYPVDSVMGSDKTVDGWQLTVNVLEHDRNPIVVDALVEYIIDLDEAGDVIDWLETVLASATDAPVRTPTVRTGTATPRAALSGNLRGTDNVGTSVIASGLDW